MTVTVWVYGPALSQDTHFTDEKMAFAGWRQGGTHGRSEAPCREPL